MGTWRRSVRAFVVTAAFALAGCSKIYFHNGPDPAADIPPPVFHHVGVVGLVEFSEPENLKEICKDRQWSAVRTENSFVTGLVSAITWQLYTPWAFSAGCK